MTPTLLALAFVLALITAVLVLRAGHGEKQHSTMILHKGYPPVEIKPGCDPKAAHAYAAQIFMTLDELWPAMSRAYHGEVIPVPVDNISVLPKQWEEDGRNVIGETFYTWPTMKVLLALPPKLKMIGGTKFMVPDALPWELRNVARAAFIRSGGGEFDPAPGDDKAKSLIGEWWSKGSISES